MLSSEWVLLIMSGTFDIGEILAYTVAVQEEMANQNKLKDMLPAAYLVMAAGWIVCLFSLYQVIIMLKDIFQHHLHPEKFREKMAGRHSRGLDDGEEMTQQRAMV